MIRFISLLLRRLASERAVKRILKNYDAWRKDLETLPAYSCSGSKLLVIRMDDIGDYLVFRNNLEAYKGSANWEEIVLLGNSAWRSFFEALDALSVDRVIWVDKSRYLQDRSYRNELWMQLRLEGFGTVICPSRTRPLLIDDLCVQATGAQKRIGAENTFRHDSWNQLSDSGYMELFRPSDPLIHEFHFNAEFAQWCCGAHYRGGRPTIPENSTRVLAAPYILCFIGANTRSRRWTAGRWAEFIALYRQHYPHAVIMAGGEGDTGMAMEIRKTIDFESIVGRKSLEEMIDWASGAIAVITNNTMAAHLAISCGRPTVIVANGDNYLRFTEYKRAGIPGVATVYPEVFWRQRRKKGDVSIHYTAVSADIATIRADTVLEAYAAITDRQNDIG